MHVSKCYSDGLEAFEEVPTLFFEFHGSENGTRNQAAFVQDVAMRAGWARFAYASSPEERTRLRKRRHAACYATVH